MQTTQRGFAPIIVVLLVIFVAATTVGTVYVLKKNTKSNLMSTTPTATPEPSSAAESEDEKICDKKPDQDQKDSCYSGIARTMKNPSLCDKIQDRVIKDNCYSYTIRFGEDLSICDKISDQNLKDDCYSYAIRSKKDSSICGKIQEQRIKDGCYLNIASVNQDPPICDKISDQDLKNTCYSGIAKTKQDPSICDRMQNQDTTVRCYWAVVAVNQDLSVCDKIQSQASKEYCRMGDEAVQNNNDVPIQPGQSIISNWKTYTNAKQKYSFKHPLLWVFRVLFSSPDTSGLNVTREEISNQSEYNSNWFIKISAWDNPANLSLIDWLRFRKEPGGLIPKNILFIPNTVVGKAEITALQTWIGGTSTWDKPGECFQACPSLDVYFTYKDKGYRVELTGSDATKKESQAVFTDILSTFEFIDK